MENKKDKAALNDVLLDKVSGGAGSGSDEDSGKCGLCGTQGQLTCLEKNMTTGYARYHCDACNKTYMTYMWG